MKAEVRILQHNNNKQITSAVNANSVFQ